MMPKVERLPPVTIEFLRVVQGVEAVRLQCVGCKSVHVAPWADLGLSNDSSFPPSGTTWMCSTCGGTDITATPEWPAEPKREGEALTEAVAPPGFRDAVADDQGAISPELRERLEAMLARLGGLEG